MTSTVWNLPDLSDALAWQVLDAADIGLIVTDARRRVLYVNAAFVRDTGYTPDDMRGRSCSVLQGSGTDPAHIAAMRAALDRGEGFSQVLLNYHKDGRPLHYRVRVTPLHDGTTLRYFVGVQEDCTEEVLARQHLERQAFVDGLTGLGNRRAFDQLLAATVQGGAGQLILFDLNDFKRVNDEQGHPAGDELLRAVARRLTHLYPAGRTFRLGGDEFAVILPEPCRHPERQVRAALEDLNGGQLRVAIGAARCPEEGRTAEALHRLADQRLYADKPRARVS